MPTRTAVNSVQVFRDGKIKTIKPGQKFNFTSDEIEDIKRLKPGAIKAVDVDADETVVETAEQKADRVKREKEEADRVTAQNKAAQTAAEAKTPAGKAAAKARSADDL